MNRVPCKQLTLQCGRPGQPCEHCAIQLGHDLREMPIIRSIVRRSKDRRYIIQQTTITSVKPVAYYEAVMGGKLDRDADQME